MLRTILRRIWTVFTPYTRECDHASQEAIDESGDGTVVEWECICCDYIRVEDSG